MADVRYKAFVSYSWRDAGWGNWLHSGLETYRTPKSLIGRETPRGPLPAALHPLFKDREEEAAGASIGAAVEAALGAPAAMTGGVRSARGSWSAARWRWRR
jgi:hypothetical protein